MTPRKVLPHLPTMDQMATSLIIAEAGYLALMLRLVLTYRHLKEHDA